MTPQRIAEVALNLLDEATVDAPLTVRAIAARLGIKAPSLYAHVSGIDEVIDLVHERINADIDLSVISDTTDLDAFRRFIVMYRNVYRAHPMAASIITRRGINQPHALLVYDSIADFLTRCGVPQQRVMPLMAFLDNLVLGSAVEPFAQGFELPPQAYNPDFPALSRALSESVPASVDDFGFEIGTEAFLSLLIQETHTH